MIEGKKTTSAKGLISGAGGRNVLFDEISGRWDQGWQNNDYVLLFAGSGDYFPGGGQLFIPPSGRADAAGGKVWSWTRLPLFFQRLYFHDRVGY